MAHPWAGYLGRRVLWALVLACVLLAGTFALVQLVPGDPARNVVGLQASQAADEQVRRQLGLTAPVLTQFGRYLSGLLHGDLGTSFSTGQPVSVLIGQRLPVTAELASLALLIVLVAGFPAGIAAGALRHRGRAGWASSLFTVLASLGGAMPEYITGTLLTYIAAVSLHLLSAQGGASPAQIILPALSVSLAPTAVFARIIRDETAVVLGRDYITTARSKRLPAWRLYLAHVLPNVVTSTLTLGGLLLVALLGGTVITENVFSIPGLGTEIVQAILQSDYPVVQGIILVLGLLAIAINLGVDMVLGLLDPRTLARAGRPDSRAVARAEARAAG